MSTSSLITSASRVFGVFGHPVAHSLSPQMQNAGLAALGVPGVYLAFDVEPEHLMDTLSTFSRLGAGGINLTIPLKEVAFRNLTDLADSARLAGSVNTIVFGSNRSMTGHSTDGIGLRQTLTEEFGMAFSGRSVLVLGCGGAGRAAALQAAADGAERIVLANRTRSRAEAVEAEIRARTPGVLVRTATSWPPGMEEVREVDLVVQSTSLGMHEGEEAGLAPGHFREGQCLLDMTYVRRVTPTMRVAGEAGARAVNGLGMLLHQGVESLRLWTGLEPPVEVMRDALIRAAYPEEHPGV